MPETVSSCPLCGSPDSRLFDQRKFRERPVTNVICHECGLVYQTPRMTEAESKAFYEAEYRLLYQGQEGPDPKDLAVQAARAQGALKFVSGQVKGCTRHLDIGCSAGVLLQKFASHYQCQATGVEPGTSYREFARSQGLRVYSSLDEINHNGKPNFDLVSMMHVLEHLPNPVDYLRDLRLKCLLPAGWLLIEVPNLFAHDSFELAHLVSYSTHTLVQVVTKAGFKVTLLRAHGLPRSRLIPLYLSLLAQPGEVANNPTRPEHLVGLKRRAGFFYRRVVTRLAPRQAWIEPQSMGGK